MKAIYTLWNKDGSRTGKIVMRKSSFSGGDPIISEVRRLGTDITTSQVIVDNMCAKDARSLIKLVSQMWTGVKIYKNNKFGEIVVYIPRVERPKKLDAQEEKTFNYMIKSIELQNNMFNIIASVEASLCGVLTCKECMFCSPIGKTQHECLALKYSNYRDKVNRAFEKMSKQEEN